MGFLTNRNLYNWVLEVMEWHLLRLQGRTIDNEDKLVQQWAKDDKFSIKQLCKELEPRRLANFPSKVIWKSWAPPNMGDLCLGSNLE